MEGRREKEELSTPSPSLPTSRGRRDTKIQSNSDLLSGPRKTTPLFRVVQPLIWLGAPDALHGGANNVLWCATSSDLRPDDNGGYFLPVGKRAVPAKQAQDPALAEKLWDFTESLLGKNGFS